MKKFTLTGLLVASLALTACGGGSTPTGEGSTGGGTAPKILGTSVGSGKVQVTTDTAASCTVSYNQAGVAGSVNLAQTTAAGYVYAGSLASGTYNNVKLSCSNANGTVVDSLYNGGNVTIKV